MKLKFLEKIFPKKTQIKLRNNLSIVYFTNLDRDNQIQKNGYTIIKNVVSEDHLAFLLSTYQQLTQFPEYSIDDKFQNSGRYRSPEIRSFVMDNIADFSKKFLPQLFDTSLYDENTTGAF